MADKNAAGERPKRAYDRLSLSQIVREQFIELRQRRAERSSVKISRGQRGGVAIEVVVHAGDDADTVSIADVAARARRTYDELCLAYPVADADLVDQPRRPAKEQEDEAPALTGAAADAARARSALDRS